VSSSDAAADASVGGALLVSRDNGDDVGCAFVVASRINAAASSQNARLIVVFAAGKVFSSSSAKTAGGKRRPHFEQRLLL
jgi:hypothetical protein